MLTMMTKTIKEICNLDKVTGTDYMFVKGYTPIKKINSYKPLPRLAKKIYFGGDPEFFVFNLKTRKVDVPEFLLKDGVDKHNGIKITKHVTMYLDGPAVELSITPSSEAINLYDRFHEAIEKIDEFLKRNGYGVVPKASSAKFDNEKYLELRAKYPGIFAIGCSVDISAYGEIEEFVDNVPLRHAGGHIHLGLYEEGAFDYWDSFFTELPKAHENYFINIARQLRRFERNTNIFYNGYLSRMRLNYSVYGALRYRPKPYGVEIRCINASTWWSKKFFEQLDANKSRSR